MHCRSTVRDLRSLSLSVLVPPQCPENRPCTAPQMIRLLAIADDLPVLLYNTGCHTFPVAIPDRCTSASRCRRVSCVTPGEVTVTGAPFGKPPSTESEGLVRCRQTTSLQATSPRQRSSSLVKAPRRWAWLRCSFSSLHPPSPPILSPSLSVAMSLALQELCRTDRQRVVRRVNSACGAGAVRGERRSKGALWHGSRHPRL